MNAKTSFFLTLVFILLLQIVIPSQVLADADAGPDQTVYEGYAVYLDGSGSTAEDDDDDDEDKIRSYRWEQVKGRPKVVLEGADQAVASFIAPQVSKDKTLTFKLTVTFASGSKDTDKTKVHVLEIDSNDPPTADAGPDQDVDEETTVILDGSNSFDPDDRIESYRWRQIAGPSVSLSDPEAVQPAFLAPDVGPDGVSLTFELTVTDLGGLQSSDTTIVNVIWLNDPPTANAGADQKVLEESTVTLDGSNSFDPDDGIESYRWKQVAGRSVTFSDPTSDRPIFEAPNFDDGGDKPLVFELTVTDNGGLQSSDSTSVSVSNFEKDNPGASGGGCFIDTAAYKFLMEQ